MIGFSFYHSFCYSCYGSYYNKSLLLMLMFISYYSSLFKLLFLFEKGNNEQLHGEYGRIVVMDIKTKHTSTLNDKINQNDDVWQLNRGASYCAGKSNINYQENDCVFRVGGRNLEIPNILYRYDTFSITKLPRSQNIRAGARSLYCEKKGVILVGGSLYDQKSSHLLASVEQLIHDKSLSGSEENTTDKYDKTSENKEESTAYKWVYLHSVKTKRTACTLGSFHNSEKVIMIGGSDENLNVLNTCEIYDWAKNDWSYISTMNVGRYVAGITVWKERNSNIITIGGEPSCKSCEEYDCNKNAWYKMADTLHSHALNPAVYVYNKVLYVIGDNGTANSGDKWGVLESYDSRQGKWQATTNLRNILGYSEEDCQHLYLKCILPTM